MKSTHLIKMAVAAAALCGAAATAQTFNYNSGDLLAAFRTSGGSQNLIVDLGSASLYQNATGSFSITGVNSTLLTSVFGSLNNVYWSVFGYVNTAASPLGPQNTIWVTDPRSDNTLQNDPNSSLTSSGQGQVISKMRAIADGATSAFATVQANQIVTVSSSLNVGGDPVSYTVGVGPLSDFNGTWAPAVENQTSSGFGTSSTPSVSDLFQQNPGAANNGIYLGNFQLNNDGTFAFNSVNPVPEPSAWALIGTGMMTLLAVRRFRNNQ
jgi:hypothetical protein